MYYKLLLFGALTFISIFLNSCASQEQAVQEPVLDPYQPTPDHAGMWLMPQLEGNLYQMLTERGLELEADDLYHPENPSIHNAVIRINIGDQGGGTGSFVSENGLILTNHHVAFDAIASARNAGHNYLQTGFYAEDMDQEMPAPGYTLTVPVKQIDVTDQILESISSDLPHSERSMEIAVAKERVKEYYRHRSPGKLVEIDSYWSGNRFLLSTYQEIRDVRLVYAPEQSIGKFGGETDNWMWPRHTPDFAFLRAYVAPDGSPEEYSPGNIPFTPGHSLTVRAGNLKPGDFTLTLGYPGTTYRYESSYAFHYYENYQFSTLKKAFSAYLRGLEKESELDPYKAIENSAEIASISNSLKYFTGIEDGFQRLGITDRKKAFESRFKEWAESDSLRKLRYGRVLPQLEQSYRIAAQTGDALYLTFYSLQFSNVLQLGTLLNDFYETNLSDDELYIPSEERLQLYDTVRMYNDSMVHPAERIKLTGFLDAMTELPEDRRPLVFYQFFESTEPEALKSEIHSFVDRQFDQSILTNPGAAYEWIFSSYESDFAEVQPPDSLFLIARDIQEMFEQSRDNYFRHFRYLEPAQQRYTEGILKMLDDPYLYPDANFTLRLSAGEITGYRPADGVYYLPFTTFEGMKEKHTGREPFYIPERLLMHQPTGSHSPYTDMHGSLPVNFLSSNDITGGNSGSPVLNRKGELVGVAFDGNIEGIVSDYHYIPELARTISADIRFILFLMSEIDQTERLLNELTIVRDK